MADVFPKHFLPSFLAVFRFFSLEIAVSCEFAFLDWDWLAACAGVYNFACFLMFSPLVDG